MSNKYCLLWEKNQYRCLDRPTCATPSYRMKIQGLLIKLPTKYTQFNKTKHVGSNWTQTMDPIQALFGLYGTNPCRELTRQGFG
jgi:hypothetical protein